jgi:hypothetical protein
MKKEKKSNSNRKVLKSDDFNRLRAIELRGSERIEGINRPALSYIISDTRDYPRAPLSER